MENQTTLTPEELEQLFAQIKKTGNDKLGDKIYNTYLPFVKKYAKTYKLSYQEVLDVYDEVIGSIYNNILEGADARLFNMYFRAIMDKKCAQMHADAKSEDHEFKSSLLQTSYERGVASNTLEVVRKGVANRERMTRSLLYTIQVLTELKADSEFAAEYNLDENKISIFEDYHGINVAKTPLTMEEICEKYNITEGRVKAVVVRVTDSLRKIDALKNVRSQLK